MTLNVEILTWKDVFLMVLLSGFWGLKSHIQSNMYECFFFYIVNKVKGEKVISLQLVFISLTWEKWEGFKAWELVESWSLRFKRRLWLLIIAKEESLFCYAIGKGWTPIVLDFGPLRMTFWRVKLIKWHCLKCISSQHN
jgi:hypothetical protein